MSIQNLAFQLSEIETVSVFDYSETEDGFAVGFVVDEGDLGWIALESLATLASNNDLKLQLTKSDLLPYPMFFELSGAIEQLTITILEVTDLVYPPSEMESLDSNAGLNDRDRFSAN